MKIKYFLYILIILVLVSHFFSCSFTDNLLSAPLSTEEEKFLGSWQHVHGIGNVWNKEFSDDRTVHTWNTNLIWGDTEGFYIWEADGENLFFYERNTLLLHEESCYTYSFIDETSLVLDGNTYEKQ